MLYYLTVLVHSKTTIHLSVAGQWWIFTSLLHGLVNTVSTTSVNTVHVVVIGEYMWLLNNPVTMMGHSEKILRSSNPNSNNNNHHNNNSNNIHVHDKNAQF